MRRVCHIVNMKNSCGKIVARCSSATESTTDAAMWRRRRGYHRHSDREMSTTEVELNDDDRSTKMRTNAPAMDKSSIAALSIGEVLVTTTTLTQKGRSLAMRTRSDR